eukprot:scpid84909/ scgid32097/ 
MQVIRKAKMGSIGLRDAQLKLQSWHCIYLSSRLHVVSFTAHSQGFTFAYNTKLTGSLGLSGVESLLHLIGQCRKGSDVRHQAGFLPKAANRSAPKETTDG